MTVKNSVATIVNFCSNEKRFIRACLEQALLFSEQVIVPVASHFFDGEPEDDVLLEQMYSAFPECFFVKYPFIPQKIPRRFVRGNRASAFWHCVSRLVGTKMLHKDIKWVFFLDADEIAEGKSLCSWLSTNAYHHYTALRFASYWYFREPEYQAETLEDSALLIQRKALHRTLLLNDQERAALYKIPPGPKERLFAPKNSPPLFHHFSWVRSQEEMLKKVRSWGHRNDRNWEDLIQKEFTHPFQGVDFVHHYRFRTVQPPFDLVNKSFVPRGKKQLRSLTERELLRLICPYSLIRWFFSS